jgi:membrane protein implicated in regulation of membrane protease activity
MPEALKDGRYVIVGSLGEGSQGRTFDAVDKREGQPVAIKRFDVRGATSWKDVDLAEREARVLQSLSHPKLPRYIDRFEVDGALYLVMEKIEGESLAAIRKRDGGLDEKQVLRLLRDAAEVLDYLHRRSPPVIHRDLKPGNVLRRPDGSFAFVDFGAVRDKLKPEGGSTVVGTFGYMAPEQFQGRALPGSDVYAVGATAITMLTGRDPEDLPHKGLAIDVRAALKGRASERTVAVLEKMLDPDPDRRASRIAPLLEGLARERPASAPRSRSRDVRAEQRELRDEIRERVDRFAERRARREARRAERRARRLGRRGRRRGAPFPFSIVITLVFLVAMLAVSLATQVVVPLLLTLLSLVFARRPLAAAAQAVRDGGHRAVEAMDRARRGAHGDVPEGAAQVRVDDEAAAPRVRVDEPTDEDGGEEEDRQGATPPGRQGSRGRGE